MEFFGKFLRPKTSKQEAPVDMAAFVATISELVNERKTAFQKAYDATPATATEVERNTAAWRGLSGLDKLELMYVEVADLTPSDARMWQKIINFKGSDKVSVQDFFNYHKEVEASQNKSRRAVRGIFINKLLSAGWSHDEFEQLSELIAKAKAE